MWSGYGQDVRDGQRTTGVRGTVRGHMRRKGVWSEGCTCAGRERADCESTAPSLPVSIWMRGPGEVREQRAEGEEPGATCCV